MKFTTLRVEVKYVDLGMLFDSLKLSPNIARPYFHDGIIFFYYKPYRSVFSVERLGVSRLLVTSSLPTVSPRIVMKVKRELRKLYVVRVLSEAMRMLGFNPEAKYTYPMRVKSSGVVAEYTGKGSVRIAYASSELLSRLVEKAYGLGLHLKHIYRM